MENIYQIPITSLSGNGYIILTIVIGHNGQYVDYGLLPQDAKGFKHWFFCMCLPSDLPLNLLYPLRYQSSRNIAVTGLAVLIAISIAVIPYLLPAGDPEKQ